MSYLVVSAVWLALTIAVVVINRRAKTKIQEIQRSEIDSIEKGARVYREQFRRGVIVSSLMTLVCVLHLFLDPDPSEDLMEKVVKYVILPFSAICLYLNWIARTRVNGALAEREAQKKGLKSRVESFF